MCKAAPKFNSWCLFAGKLPTHEQFILWVHVFIMVFGIRRDHHVQKNISNGAAVSTTSRQRLHQILEDLPMAVYYLKLDI